MPASTQAVCIVGIKMVKIGPAWKKTHQSGQYISVDCFSVCFFFFFKNKVITNNS